MSDSRIENQLDDIIEELGGEPSGGTALSRVESKLNDILALIEGGGGGTGNYEELENKPSINGTELIGDKELIDFGIDIPSDDHINGLIDAKLSALDGNDTEY